MSTTPPAKPTNPLKLDPKYDDYDFPTTAPVAQSGHPGHTTPEQDAQVAQLRMMLEALGYTDRLDTLTLLRFLRARKFNVEAAKTMFVACEQWRRDFGTDSLVTDFHYTEKEQVFEYYPQYYHKTDKDGRPVYIEQLGKIDLTAMYKITTSERMLKSLVCEYEKLADPRLPACARKSGHLLETCCTIMDLKGVGISNAASVFGYIKQASAISQNYYPERLGKLYIINAPWGFSTVFSVVKGFLDPVTVSKINVLGSGYEKELLAQVPAENLPKQFGGQCECPGGCPFSDMGPWQESEWAKPPKWAKKDDKGEEGEKKEEGKAEGEEEKKEDADKEKAAAAPAETTSAPAQKDQISA
ncbi:SEC14 cytosolic factor [Coccidioides immitis RS]|uniref:SEC14 cytosolic factor n=4 Tax=Coccidioides immitis TaxID=5501 RepID=J3KKB1_COCIM|nr:SEC14 cytosolic factor [Coccidioides immitis RS]KMP01960.1 SEC14 cytosolic factor [Coccidioides immitis RMSCC 2394]KMU79889.1 SEC14 cytosolic factor [Coccidioides immitis RMSCC 3703]KMU88146.1 SEC14 cytosolic factor [Coccidioides immitis H538.4]TPX25310.1 cytosolic factor, phosphatidylinositol/phosphatidylcholine transfer protein [Coccidioides immitis]EAS36595.3 SEC14 cytosolic factor [Coccidioides immitis RS]